jgi:hypothetical protein
MGIIPAAPVPHQKFFRKIVNQFRVFMHVCETIRQSKKTLPVAGLSEQPDTHRHFIWQNTA